jgi:hypothetical protein
MEGHVGRKIIISHIRHKMKTVITVYLIRYGVAVRAIVYLILYSQLPIDNDVASKFDVTAWKLTRER